MLALEPALPEDGPRQVIDLGGKLGEARIVRRDLPLLLLDRAQLVERGEKHVRRRPQLRLVGHGGSLQGRRRSTDEPPARG